MDYLAVGSSGRWLFALLAVHDPSLSTPLKRYSKQRNCCSVPTVALRRAQEHGFPSFSSKKPFQLHELLAWLGLVRGDGGRGGTEPVGHRIVCPPDEDLILTLLSFSFYLRFFFMYY